MSKTILKIFLFGVFFISTACTSLSPKGERVAFTKAVGRSCKKLKTVNQEAYTEESEDAEIKVRNLAGDLGGTHVLFEYANRQRSAAGIYRCLDITRLDEICEIENNALACYDFAVLTEASNFDDPALNEKAYDFFKRGCELKDGPSCREEKRVEKIVLKDRAIQEQKNKCTSGDSQECLRVMASVYQEGNLEAAIQFAQLACVHGQNRGCDLHRDLVSQKNENRKASASERAAYIQAQAIENSAQVQAEAARSAAAIQANTIGNAINQLSQQQQAVQPIQQLPGPSYKTKKTNCKPGLFGSVDCTTTEH